VSEPEVPHFYPDRRTGSPDGPGGPGPGSPVVLTGADLTIAEVEAVAREGAAVALDIHARERMQEARDVVEALVAEGAVVYGVTTGFGALASTRIEPADAGRLQENLLMSHAAGVGPAFPREVVRAMLLLRANTLALGHSGCRPLLVDRLLEFLAAGIHPVVPEQGSVGASGDLAPLAHLALPLIGRGRVEFQGHVTPALVALREVGLEPLTLEAKEGLALLNGTQMMSAIGALLLADADRLARTASVIAAMSVEALLGTDVAFAAAYQLARPHPGQIAVAAELRHLLRDSALQAGHHGHAHKVQDPYSLRCIPQVHGAVRDTLDHLRRVLDIELNSATDNPLVFPGGGVADVDTLATGGGRVISGGNFHGEPIALALDFAKIALAELGSISERRTALLVDPRLNGGLPPFLAADSGIDSGMMIYQYTAAALASENKVLAHPASVDSIPTSANQEDHVSMGSIAARHARTVLGHVEAILAIELLVAAQALDLRVGGPDGAAPGSGVAEALARVRERVRHLDGDREPGPDLAAATAMVHDAVLADLADLAGTSGPAA
jgi:histidine ammonia-lyase